MLRPTPMIQLAAVVLEPDVDSVTKALLEAGVIDFVDTREIAGGFASSLGTVGGRVSIRSIEDLRSRIEAILEEGEYPLPRASLDISALEEIDIARATTEVDLVAEKIQAQRSEEREARQELLRLEDIQSQLRLFGSVEAGLKSASTFSYLSIQTGSIDADRIEALREAFAERPTVVVQTRTTDTTAYLVVIGLKRDQDEVDKILDSFGWNDVELTESTDVDEQVGGDVGARLESTRERIETAKQSIRTIVEESGDGLARLWAQLKLNELYARIQSNFARTKRTILFTGWLPESRRVETQHQIEQACSDRCYIEWRRPTTKEREQIPVQLRNPRFLQPFELLVRNYAVPEYGSIDPTAIVAVCYLIMFGLMFGDAGHGLVLALVGLVGRRFAPRGGNVRKLLTLLVWCGSASIVTGALFGSYFGMRLFPPIWFDYHAVVSGHSGGSVESIYDVLAITIYFGIGVIGLGLLLNWINLTGSRQWFDLLFGKSGIFGGIIYGAGVWAAVFFVRHDYRQLPDATILLIVLGIPTLALGLKGPLEYLRNRKAGNAEPLHPLSFVDFGMEWIVEILEVYAGYLANTLSFMRVAGLGIAHEALMIAFFAIAEMTGSAVLPRIAILLAGNLLVIALEGLSAGIQSLRLNYYEFFSKYFVGTRRTYAPVSLRTSP